MKAMILAAGRGERLRPLTDAVPKPLVKVGQHCLIEHQILALRAAGIKQIVINLCYQAEHVQQVLGNGHHYDVSLDYCVESEPPLDTGGGVVNALSKLADAPFILTSADIFTEFPYQRLLTQVSNKAHVVLVDNPHYHQQGDFSLQGHDRVSLQSPTHTYANIGVFHPSLFQAFCLGRFPLRDVLFPAIERGEVSGEIYQGDWHNIGTAAELELCRALT